MSRLTHRLVHHVHINGVAVAFAFWIVQLTCWILMMLYVQFLNPKLGNNVLYVTQISHWALVITCGTAATATFALLQAKHNARKLDSLHALRHDAPVSRSGAEPVGHTTSHPEGW